MDFVIFLFQCNTGQYFCYVRKVPTRKFGVAEFMNFKWLYLGMYLKLGDKLDYFRIHLLLDFQNI